MASRTTIGTGVLLTLAAGALAKGAARWLRRMDLRGKVVVVTGGARGLGFAVAGEFVKRGCLLAICARNAEEVVHAVSEFRRRGARVMGQACDVSDASQANAFIESVLEHYGRIDVLVNNAGQCFVGPAAELRAEDVEAAIRNLFWIQFHPTMAVLPHMRWRRFGRIVNISSIGGKMPVPHLAAYAAGKYAATGWSETLTIELAKEGIGVSTIAPAPLRNGAGLYVHFNGQAEDEFTWFTSAQTSMLTSVSPERVARAVVDAAQHGDPERTVTPLSWLGIKAFALLPNVMLRAFGTLHRLMPPARPPGQTSPMRDASQLVAHSDKKRVALLAARARGDAQRYAPASLRLSR